MQHSSIYPFNPQIFIDTLVLFLFLAGLGRGGEQLFSCPPLHRLWARALFPNLPGLSWGKNGCSATLSGAGGSEAATNIGVCLTGGTSQTPLGMSLRPAPPASRSPCVPHPSISALAPWNSRNRARLGFLAASLGFSGSGSGRISLFSDRSWP